MSSNSRKMTSIQRVWSTTAIWVIPGTLVCLFGLYLGYTSLRSIDWRSDSTFGLILLGTLSVILLVGIVLIWNGSQKAGTAACPVCGQPLKKLSLGKNDGVWCPAGKHYVNGEKGMLWETAPDMVADVPAFTTQLTAEVQMPDKCCVCAAPATRTEKVELTETAGNGCLIALALVLSLFGNAEEKVVRALNIPHCTAHKKGAILAGTGKDPKIRFRSYPYQRTFCELNHTQPE